MTRKTTDSQAARDVAVELLRQASGTDTPLNVHRDSVAAFKAAEFETTTTKVGGQPLSMRRVVLTSEWEIVTVGS
jgi:hypothetical protein